MMFAGRSLAEPQQGGDVIVVADFINVQFPFAGLWSFHAPIVGPDITDTGQSLLRSQHNNGFAITGLKSHYPPGNHHAISTPKNVLFPSHNNLQTTSTDDWTLWLSPECQHVKYNTPNTWSHKQ